MKFLVTSMPKTDLDCPFATMLNLTDNVYCSALGSDECPLKMEDNNKLFNHYVNKEPNKVTCKMLHVPIDWQI